MSNQTHAHGQTRRARLARLPRFVQDPEMARAFLNAMPLTRMMIAAGIELTPGLGLANHDAMASIMRDVLGDERLSDEEFEHALILATPPEYRETLQ
jgi:hypothetical protein